MKTVHRDKNKVILLIAASVLIVAVGYLVYAWNSSNPPFSSRKSYSPGEYIVNKERSDSEKEVTKRIDENPEAKTQNSQTDKPIAPSVDEKTGLQAVNVLLTNTGIFNGTVSASGMVTDAIEDGGTCTFIFKNGTSKVEKTSKTMQNSTSTSCETVSFSSEELPTDGTWRVQISYSSPTSEGSSNTKEFTK